MVHFNIALARKRREAANDIDYSLLAGGYLGQIGRGRGRGAIAGNLLPAGSSPAVTAALAAMPLGLAASLAGRLEASRSARPGRPRLCRRATLASAAFG